MASAGRLVVMVPTEVAWAYTAAVGWQTITCPPVWWLLEQEQLLERDERPRGLLTLVPDLQVPMTSCRPGRGPCNRRHEHASYGRAVAG